MKILFILDHFYPHIGGVETLFTQITQKHINKGDQVIIITNNHSGTSKPHEINNGIEIYRVGKGRQNRISMILLGIKLIKTIKVDLIHTSTYSAALPAWIISKIYHIPNQIHIHEIYGALWHQFLGIKAYCNKRFEKIIVGLLPRDRYICVSRYTLNSVRTHFNLPDHKLFLESNPIDRDFWKPYDQDQKVKIREQRLQQINKTQLSTLNPKIGLYYGRTGKEKGLDLYIKALPSIIKQNPNFHAVIIAPDHESKPNFRSKKQTSYSLKRMIKQLGLKNHITRLPPVHSKQEIKDRIAASDIVILPSRTEGFGYAMHEVAIMNTPLITTSVGGQIETLSEYTNIHWTKQVTSNEITERVKVIYQQTKQ